MIYDEIYEEIQPYLANPQSIKEFLDKNKEKKIEELIENVNRMILDSNSVLKTDFRIFLNALLKHR